MRKAFKPYLRHPLSKKPTVTGPNEPEEVEVTILPQWDTVLRYDGSPLMVEGKVDDPNSRPVIRGENQSYELTDENGNERDWIAIGLATDNDPIDEFRSPKEHPDADDDGDPNNDGVVYTNIGPTRSVLSFNLEDIPAGAEITEAFLELVPVTDKSSDDVWNEFDGTINNVWPSTGVQCEILNLVEEAEEDCTWNTTTIDDRTVDGVDYPHPPTRWYRQGASSQIPPNPIGAVQNSKRWDIQEPVQSFLDQYSGAAGNDIADTSEFYGHIGYGLRGGGAVENVPEDINQLSRFRIPKEAHEDQHDANNQINEASITQFQNIDVFRAVTYAHAQQNRICNLLLRASHWNQTDLNENQLDLPIVPDPLTLTSITLEDSVDQDTDVELDHDAIVQFIPPTFDQDGDEIGDLTWVEKAAQDGWTVNYDWQVKYPPISNFTYDVFRNGEKVADQGDRTGSGNGEPLTFVAGDVLTVGNISSDGGFENEHIFEFYVDDVGNGLGNSLTIAASDIPEGPEDPSLTVDVFVGARAQGANTGDGDNYFPQTFSRIQSLGVVANDTSDDDVVDDQPTYEISFNPISGSGDFVNSAPNQTHTVTGTFTITNPRPGFDWDSPQPPMTGITNIKTVTIQNETLTELGFLNGNITEISSTVDEDSEPPTATNIFELTFNGQDILASNELFTDDMNFTVNIGLSYVATGTDEADGDEENPNGDYTDTFQTDGSNNGSYSFNILQDNTSNDFDITDPANRRGVFEVFGIHNLTDAPQSINPDHATRANQPDSSVKAPVRQVELAPTQLKCDTGETFNTVLMPIEEVSRFDDNPFTGGIRGTKNKFAVLAGGANQSGINESNIRTDTGSLPNVPGTNSARPNLVTSGGVGEFVERKREANGTLTDIFVPSDLAVYYFNRNPEPGELCGSARCETFDNTGQDCSYHVGEGANEVIPGEDYTGCPTEQDLGWVYYRALSRVGGLNTNNGRFRITGELTRDYNVDDFDSDFNEDDGLEYVLWEKLSGDRNGDLDVVGGFDGTDPNIGAFVFLLNDRYDNVDTPTTEELEDRTKWPVPLSTAFRLTEYTPTPRAENSDDARNNPTLLDQFSDAGSRTDIIDIIDYEIKSLDNGGDSDCVFATIDEDGNELVAPVDDGSTSNNSNGLHHLQRPKRFHGLPTRDSDGKIIPLTTAHSLFLGAPDLESNDSLTDICKITPYNSLDFADSLNGPWEGDAMDQGVGSYCNFKSHFWNGKGIDNDWNLEFNVLLDVFQGDNSDLPTGGPIPLIWRRRDTPYFVHHVNNNFNTTTPLPHPLTSQINPQSSLAYHGINILHGNLHKRLRTIRDEIQQEHNIETTPIVQYVVEVIRGGSVYHRDLYRLSGSQSTDPNTPADADFVCKACRSSVNPDPNCQDALNYGSQSEVPRDLADTLYQFGTDGEAWRDDTEAETSWYAPSDWRAGDTIRVYAIAPHIEGDTVIDPNTGDVISADPTPPITRIKKYCTVGEWTRRISSPPCCLDVPVGQNCEDGTVCVVVCYLPPGDWGGIDPDSSGDGGGIG